MTIHLLCCSINLITITMRRTSKFSRKNLLLSLHLFYAACFSIVFSHNLLIVFVRCDDQNGSDQIGLSVAEMVRLRNFTAEEHYVTTTDGYILQLVRMLNPLVGATGNGSSKIASSKKLPILFIHGAKATGALFVANSINARPKDLSQLDAGKMSIANLTDLLLDEPASKSLPMLASLFGHEVWLLQRRGVTGSRGVVEVKNKGRTNDNSSRCFQCIQQSYNSVYWNYSLDEQVNYDLPEVIEYVLNKTGSLKINVVGHSVGGALTLMVLTQNPDISDKSTSINTMKTITIDDVNIVTLHSPLKHSIQGSSMGTVIVSRPTRRLERQSRCGF